MLNRNCCFVSPQVTADTDCEVWFLGHAVFQTILRNHVEHQHYLSNMCSIVRRLQRRHHPKEALTDARAAARVAAVDAAGESVGEPNPFPASVPGSTAGKYAAPSVAAAATAAASSFAAPQRMSRGTGPSLAPPPLSQRNLPPKEQSRDERYESAERQHDAARPLPQCVSFRYKPNRSGSNSAQKPF